LSKSRLVKLAERLDTNQVYIAQHTGPILLAVLSLIIGIWGPEEYNLIIADEKRSLWIVTTYWTFWGYIIAIVLTGYGAFCGTKQSVNNEKEIQRLNEKLEQTSALSNDLEEAQLAIVQMRADNEDTIYKVSSNYLAHVTNDLLRYDDTERASLYLHYENNFILAGRYSKNPTYCKRNRTEFPSDQGCIGKIWSNGGESFDKLPNYKGEQRVKHLKNSFNIDKGTARKLRMNSIEYCGYAIMDGYKRVGIIMFESLNQGVLESSEIKSLVDSHSQYLVEMLKLTKSTNAFILYQSED